MPFTEINHLLDISEEYKNTLLEKFQLTRYEYELSVRDMINWMKYHRRLININPDVRHLENIMLRAKGFANSAKTAINQYYILRVSFPELYRDRNSSRNNFSLPFEGISFVILPKLTASGCRIIIIKFHSKMERFVYNDFYVIMLMVFDITLRFDYIGRFICIFDYTNFTTDHVKGNDGTLKIFNALREGFLVRIKRIHLLNPPKTYRVRLTKFAEALNDKSKGRIHIHPNLKSLHEVVDKTLLPKDYGGIEKPMRELEGLWFNELLLWGQWFCMEDKDISNDLFMRTDIFDTYNINNLLNITFTHKIQIMKWARLNRIELKKAGKELSGWFQTQPHLNHIKPDIRLLESLYVRSKKNVHTCTQSLDLYYAMKAQVPELFQNRDPGHKDFRVPFEGISFAFLKRRTLTNTRIMIMKYHKNTKRFSVYDFYKIMLMFFEIIIRYDYVRFLILVCDFTNLRQSHLAKMDLLPMRQAIFALQSIFLVNIRECHILGYTKICKPIVETFRSSAHRRLRYNIYYHRHFKNLHFYVNPIDLPADLGGAQKSTRMTEELWFHQIQHFRNWFIQEDNNLADESKRPYNVHLDYV